MRTTRFSRRPALVASCLVAVLTLAGAARSVSADGPTLAQHLEQKAPTVVCVKLVVSLHISAGGQAFDQEQKGETRGAMVDTSGLVMMYDASNRIRAMMRSRPGTSVTVTPTSIKVLFGNEAKEHEAVLVVRDSILGLSYLQIVDLEGRTPAVADLSSNVEPKVGEPLFGVSRLARSFDCAPEIGTLYVSMPVKQPRPMWAITGSFAGIGLPVYAMSGAAVGILTEQEGSEGADEGGGGPDMQTCLLPLPVIRKSIEAAKKRVPEALEKAKAAKEAPKEPEPAMEGEPSMGEPPAPPAAPDKPK